MTRTDLFKPDGSPRRDGRRLSLPLDLHEKMRDVSRETGIPLSRIAEQGIRLRLAQIEAGQVKAA